MPTNQPKRPRGRPPEPDPNSALFRIKINPRLADAYAALGKAESKILREKIRKLIAAHTKRPFKTPDP